MSFIGAKEIYLYTNNGITHRILLYFYKYPRVQGLLFKQMHFVFEGVQTLSIKFFDTIDKFFVPKRIHIIDIIIKMILKNCWRPTFIASLLSFSSIKMIGISNRAIQLIAQHLYKNVW